MSLLLINGGVYFSEFNHVLNSPWQQKCLLTSSLIILLSTLLTCKISAEHSKILQVYCGGGEGTSICELQ